MRETSEYDRIVSELHSLSGNSVSDLPDVDPVLDFSVRLSAMEIKIHEMQMELSELRAAS